MTQLQLALADLAGLLEDLVDRIPGAETALLLTADGRSMATWGGAFPRTATEVSTIACTLQGMAESQMHLGPAWRTLVALDHQLFALAPAGPEAIFGVTLNGLAALDSVLDDTATAAEQAWRVLDMHTSARPEPGSVERRQPFGYDPGYAAAPLDLCAPDLPSDDELERMLSHLRSL